ncbi:hypothetical protein IJO12_05390 [bacterium]|nr:hypothetical protein [bacterium]
MVGYFNLQLNTPRFHLNMFNTTPCLSNQYSFGTLVTPQIMPINFGCNSIPWIGDLFSTNQTMGSLNILYNSNAWVNQARAGMTYCNMMPGAFSQYYPMPSLQDTINAFMRDNTGLQMPAFNFTNPWSPVTPGRSTTTTGNVADAVAQETFNELHSFMTKFIDNTYSGAKKTTHKTTINNIKNSSDTIAEKLKKLKAEFKKIADADTIYNYLKNNEDVSININSTKGSIAYWLTECGLVPTEPIKKAAETLKNKLSKISDANTSINSDIDRQNAGILEYISAYNDNGSNIIDDFDKAYNKISDNNSKQDFKNTFATNIVQPLINAADDYIDSNALDDTTKEAIKNAKNDLSEVSDKTPRNVEDKFNKLYVLLRLASATVINVELTNSYGAFGDVFKFDNNDTNTVANKIYNNTIEDLKNENPTNVDNLKVQVIGKPEEVVTTEIEEEDKDSEGKLPDAGTKITEDTMTNYCSRSYLAKLSNATVTVTTSKDNATTTTSYQVYKVEKTNPAEYVALVDGKIKKVTKDSEGNYALDTEEITIESMNDRCKLMENIKTDKVIKYGTTTKNTTTGEFESDTYTMNILDNVFGKAPEYTMKSYKLYKDHNETNYEDIKEEHEKLNTASVALKKLVSEYDGYISYDDKNKVFTYNGKNYALFADGNIYEVKSNNGNYQKQEPATTITIEKLKEGAKKANELKTKMDKLANASENDELKYDDKNKVYTYENRSFQIINGKVFEVTKGEDGKYTKLNNNPGMTDTEFNEMIAEDIADDLFNLLSDKTYVKEIIENMNTTNVIEIMKAMKTREFSYHSDMGISYRHLLAQLDLRFDDDTHIETIIKKLIETVKSHPNYNRFEDEFTKIISKLEEGKTFFRTSDRLDALAYQLIEKYEQLDNIESQQ